MLQATILFFALVGVSNAGILKTLAYPFRHPVKVLKVPAKAVIFPITHPKRFWVKDHGPTLPPDPWSDARKA